MLSAPTPSPRGVEPWLTAPNLLTLSRLPLAALPWVDPANLWLLLGTVAAAGVTDVLDGWAARRLRARRLAAGRDPGRVATAASTGAWLDPVCDKVFVMSTLGVVFVAVAPPWWLLGLIATREILQVPLVGLYHLLPPLRRRLALDYTAGIPGKMATATQFAALVAVRLELTASLALCVAAAVAGMASAGYYVARATRGGPPRIPRDPAARRPLGDGRRAHPIRPRRPAPRG